MEVFGRYAGHTAFRAGVAADADAVLIPEIPTDFDVLYEHCKARFMRRIEASDVNAGIYTILVAEGLRNASGEELVDEAAGVDAFGHKRLAGAGKYVANEISKRFAADSEILEFMKKVKLYVKGLYETPEIRVVAPGHIVRCGHSSVYDVNFGKEVGAAAVVLLKNGLSGVTVSGMVNGTIQYVKTQEAIKQRHVNLATVAYFENLGVCFGRVAQDLEIKFKEMKGPIERFM